MVGAERVFRVDRIRESVVLEDHFDRPKGIPDPGVGYSPSDDDVVARILLSTRAAWVLDYYPVDVINETAAGTEILFSSPDAEIPARLLLRLGGEAQLLDGEEVRSRVESMGEQLRAKYQ
jgi:predicted DNA-binding transcriptional regulator YafY